MADIKVVISRLEKFAKANNCPQAIVDALELLKEQPQWIPVSKRMPETGERVLVLDALIPSFKVMRVDYRDSERRKTFACSNRVTHWMPLPKPPKEGDVE